MRSRATNRRDVELGDAIHIKHGFAFKSQYFTDNGDFVVLTPGNFNEGGGFRLRPGKDRFYSDAIPQDYVLEKEDLIVAMTEQGPGLLGSAALVPQGGRYLHNQRLGLVDEIDTDMLDKRYLYYLFSTKTVRAQLSGTATGTKVRHTAPERIYRVKVSVPSDVKQQSFVASVLRAYDDLIENNRRRILLLEQAARLIYDEWFVRLRFPGSERAVITDGMPTGWRRNPLSALCKDVRNLTDPRELPADTPYIGLEHIPRRSITLGDWASSTEAGSTKLVFDKGDILFGKIRPCFHKVGFALTYGIVSSDAIVIRPKKRCHYEFVLLLLSSDEFVSLASRTVREGSKMPRADWGFLLGWEILVPGIQLLKSFGEIIKPILDQLRNLALANRRLTEARDSLLPHLMNGQVTV